MITLFLAFVYSLSLYLFPGMILSRLFTGRLRNNLFFSLFLSFLLLPFIYLFLASTDRLSGPNWLVLTSGLLLITILFARKFGSWLINTDKVFPSLKPDIKKDRWLKWGVSFLLVAFFLLVMSGKIGLLMGNVPVGDDKPRLQKATAVALSPQTPLFYNFPISEMTIYYFNNIPSGLLPKFTNNGVLVNQSWFIHTIISTVVMLWLIFILATGLFKTYLERVVLVFSLTFGSGLEFFLAKAKGVTVNHLEWWTDWIGLSPQLHTQISAFYTLFFWVSQHLFGGLLIVPLYFLLISTERSKLLTKFFIGLILANLVGYTVFVFLTVLGIYIFFLASRLWQKKEKLAPLIKENFVIGILSLSLAMPMILLYQGAQKGHYFVVFSNVFWFLNNNNLVNKLTNFLITIPLYLTVEFGVLIVGFILGFYYFVRQKMYKTDFLFWGLLLYLPIWVIFVVKALDDNNISMRSLIPTQIALGVISAWVVGILREKWVERRVFPAVVLGILLLTCLPTTLYEGYYRVQHSLIKADTLYAQIDRQLPPNSLIVNDSKQTTDYVSALSHRFTLKQLSEFNVTDYEYVAVGKITPLLFEKNDLYVWTKVFDAHPALTENYHLYRLDDVDQIQRNPQILMRSEELILTKLELPK